MRFKENYTSFLLLTPGEAQSSTGH